MSITFEEARDLICGRLQAQLAADYENIYGVGEEPVVYWDNLSPSSTPPKDKPWMRAILQHLGGTQNTLAQAGSRLFGRTGIITVQLFVPGGTRGSTLADRLGKMLVDAFEGKAAGEVWFRNVSLSEVGNDGPWYQINVRAEFMYEEMK